MKSIRFPFVLLLALTTLVIATAAKADKVCLKVGVKETRTGKLKTTVTRRLVVSGECPAGFKEIVDTSTLTGADGSLRIYGDGSAGSVTISSSTTLTDGNLQFQDLTINAGVTLNVTSGTVIRCAGTFTNNGTLNVGSFAAGAFYQRSDSAATVLMLRSARPGAGKAAAGNGEAGSDTAARVGGLGGEGLSLFGATMLRYPGPAGGGGGGIAPTGNFGGGTEGGGTVVILAQTAVLNTGTIRANGQNNGTAGMGGSGGGIIIIGSPGSITNSGAVNAAGGNGGAAANAGGDLRFAGGGGGGGGIVHMISPTITQGATDVTGGTGGASVAGSAGGTRGGGGGGGAGGGSGGAGGAAGSGANTFAAGTDGTDGYAIMTLADPTSLF